jgi:hypothetical protein
MIVNNILSTEKRHKVLYSLSYLFMLAGNNFPVHFSLHPPQKKDSKKVKIQQYYYTTFRLQEIFYRDILY